MTENEKMDLILLEIRGMKADMQDMKAEMQSMKADIQNMKADMQGMRTDIERLDKKVTRLELHIENATDRNIQLVAENFIELTKKLNQAIPVADKNLAYEVKVNYLIERVKNLEKEMAEVKSRIA